MKNPNLPEEEPLRSPEEIRIRDGEAGRRDERRVEDNEGSIMTEDESSSPPVLSGGEYAVWLADIRSRLRQAQLKAAVPVNTALLEFYWQPGAEIVEKQQSAAWGSGFLARLSRDLMKKSLG